MTFTDCDIQISEITKKTKYDWMQEAAEQAISLIIYKSNEAVFGKLHGFEEDGFGRTYAEIIVRSQDAWGVVFPKKYALVFLDVKDDAPCRLGPPGPRMIRYLPGFRALVRGTLRFGSSRLY